MQASPTPPIPTESRIEGLVALVDRALDRVLPSEAEFPHRLHQAMRYSVLGGGKRMRPLFALGAGEALGLADRDVVHLACALELIHAYSLIHDDLPAMDDDDLRRGRPTCHRAFDVATAILAGDALQALAFDVLVSVEPPGGPGASAAMVRALARACGSQGMAGGQALDLGAAGERLDQTELERMHRLKTGALIRCAVVLPALFAGADQRQIDALSRYGEAVGLAFQIHDDVLDVEGDTRVIGKPQGSDVARDKATFPACLGLARSRQLAGELHRSALAALAEFEGPVVLLTHLARFTIERRR